MSTALQPLPPIWVINLARSPVRRAFMQNQFNSLGLNFEFIAGVDGRSLTASDRAKYSKRRALQECGRELAPNEIGCALSHVALYHRIIEQDIREALILEDDVYLPPALFEIIHRREKFPLDWDVVNFSADASCVPIHAEPIYKEYHIGQFKDFPNRASAYLITQIGARKLLNHIYPIRFPSDGLLGRTYISKIKILGITPKLSILADLGSDTWDDPLQTVEVEHAIPGLHRKSSFSIFIMITYLFTKTRFKFEALRIILVGLGERLR